MIAAISSGAVIGPAAAVAALTILAVIGRRTDTQERRDTRWARARRITR